MEEAELIRSQIFKEHLRQVVSKKRFYSYENVHDRTRKR
jgi:hypothetical protein